MMGLLGQKTIIEDIGFVFLKIMLRSKENSTDIDVLKSQMVAPL
jgi:hypothetical protein